MRELDSASNSLINLLSSAKSDSSRTLIGSSAFCPTEKRKKERSEEADSHLSRGDRKQLSASTSLLSEELKEIMNRPNISARLLQSEGSQPKESKQQETLLGSVAALRLGKRKLTESAASHVQELELLHTIPLSKKNQLI